MKISLKRTLRATLPGWAYNKAAFPEADLEKYAAAIRQPGALTAMLNYYRAAFRFRKFNAQRAEKLISVPTRVIWGENDKALGKALTLNMEQYFSGPYEIHYIAESSHWVQHDHPERVNELILSFFQ